MTRTTPLPQWDQAVQPTRPDRRAASGRTLTALGALGVVSQILFMAGWLIPESWQPQSYSIVRDTISDLMARTAPHAEVPVILLVAAGIGTMVFALLGLRPALRAAGRTAFYAPWMLALSALGFGNVLSFLQIPCQSGACGTHAAMSTFAGVQDVVGGVIVVTLLAISPFPMSRRLKETPGWQQLAVPSLLTGVAVMASYIAFGLHSTAAVHGLLERAVATIGSGWTAVLAVNLIRTARRPEKSDSNGHPGSD
ncbi:DUF998 domain-containing protein [Planotetraspora mira]|uniref:DUF998 domain-containing protein n=1 Tax=Planotetraspora mira TaxID=58121 RepID=A0A8J3TU77_9ACTN|nr:DUF998 domain-containing protein [Planotetraspora mira]GII33040.1 hypothetical protein Pmi06nite_64820 [Planotetraspora mira]